MHTSKLVQVLKTFSNADWTALQLMASSPYYLRKREAVKIQQLISLLKTAAPTFSAAQLDKEKITSEIFLDTASESNSQLPKLMSKLLRLVETYVLAEQQKSTGEHRQILLAQAWEARGLKSLARQNLAKAERNLQTEQPNGKIHYWHQLQLVETWFTHYSSISLNESTYYLRQTEQKLDEWYLLSKLEQVVWQKAQSIQTKQEVQEGLLPIDFLLKHLKNIDFSIYPIHGIYYQALLFLHDYDNTNMETFMEVARQLQKYGHLLEADKVKALHTLLRIFATGRYNYGEDAYLSVSLELYQVHLAAGYLYFNEKIHSQTLLNMVTLGLRKGEFDWVKNLLNNHQSRILDQDADPHTFRFNQALLAFYQGNLEEAQAYLNDQYHNIYYRLAARRLEIMIYFEQRSVLLDAKMEAFKVYIFRLSQKQLPAKPKALNNNFIDILRQIAHPSTLGNAKRQARIQEKIKTADLLAERVWLSRLMVDG